MAITLKPLVFHSSTTRSCGDVRCKTTVGCSCGFVSDWRFGYGVMFPTHFYVVGHCVICSGHQLLVRDIYCKAVGDDELLGLSDAICSDAVEELNAQRILRRLGLFGKV